MDEWQVRIERKIDFLIRQDAKRQVSIAKLEVKSGFWGLIGGIIAGLLVYLKRGS